jgi:hypothetical protein
MIAAYGSKRKVLIAPGAALDAGSATANSIDCLGFDFLVVNVALGATDVAMTALKLQESDDDGDDDAYGDIEGAVYGTSDDDAGDTSTLPTATDDNKLFSFFLDLRGRKRYVKLVATAGDGSTGTYLAAWAELSRADRAPTTAAEAGYAQRLIV